MLVNNEKRNSPKELPLILYAPASPEGHMQPAMQICTYLFSQGFDVTLLGSTRWKAAVENAGMHFSSLVGLAKAGDSENLPSIPTEVMTMPLAPLLGHDFAERFATLMVRSWDVLRFALIGIAHRVGIGSLRRRGIVILSDTAFSGVLPLKLGASRPSGFEDVPIKTLGIGVVPRFWATPYHPPWGLGLPYDASEIGIARTLRAHSEQKALFQQKGGEDKVRMVLDIYGCNIKVDSLFNGYETYSSGDEALTVSHSFLDAVTICNDTTVQMSMESLEFPIPPGIKHQYVPPYLKHAGFLPLKSIPADLDYPRWFEHELVPRAPKYLSCGRKVVLVAQGTQTIHYDELVIPTIQALARESEILVIAILGRRGAAIDASSIEGGVLPSNARVLDYFPYDAILPYVDVFVSSSGFGGLTHAIANAVPLVQCGWIVDKPDIGRRVERSGLGLYIGREDYPANPDTVRSAVTAVLSNPGKYKRRALELQKESLTKYRPLDYIREEILALCA